MLMEFGALKGHSSHISGWGPNVRFWPVSDLVLTVGFRPIAAVR